MNQPQTTTEVDKEPQKTVTGLKELSIRPVDPNDTSYWKLDRALCQQCGKIMTNVLAECQSKPSDSESKTSDAAPTIHLLPEDSNRTVGSALRYLDGPCPLCALIARELRHLPETSRYWLYLRDSHRGFMFISFEQQSDSRDLACIALLQGAWPPLCPSLDSNTTEDFDDIRYTWELSQRSVEYEKDTSRILDQLKIIFPGPLRSSEEFFKAQKLSETCAGKHRKCSVDRSLQILPKRVLDLSREDGHVSLYISKNEAVQYATLSYRWGQSLPLKTMSTNIAEHCKGIPLDSFPQTLKDGIKVAKAFGFRYLWVDALCIIQDDDQDWAEQAAAMTDIYHGCSLNISAAHSQDCNSGLRRKLHDYACVVASSGEQESHLVALSAPMSKRGGLITVGPLDQRGWVFQESLVSPASLRYNMSGIEWDCRTGVFNSEGIMSESGTIHPFVEQNTKQGWNEFLSAGKASIYRSLQQTTPEQRMVYTWHDFVSDYSSKVLTVKQDKLPAVAGIAAHFERYQHWNYVAGLWKEYFWTGLTWTRAYRDENLIWCEGRAPSWSWASVDGSVQYHRVFSANNVRSATYCSYEEPDLCVIDYGVKEAKPGSFGEVLPGKLIISGCIHQITVREKLLVGSLPFPEKKRFYSIIFDAETDLSEPQEVSIIRIVKHEEWKYHGAGCLNFFLMLSATTPDKDEFRRVGVIICDFGELKMENGKEAKAKIGYQAALDKALRTQPSRFAIV